MALSRGFPRVDISTTLPFDVRTFLEGNCLRGCLTCPAKLARQGPLVKACELRATFFAWRSPEELAAQTLLNRPTTRPSTLTSLLRIGSIVSFSG